MFIYVLQDTRAQHSVEDRVVEWQLSRMRRSNDAQIAAQRNIGRGCIGCPEIKRGYTKTALPEQIGHLPVPTSPIENMTRWNLPGDAISDADVVPDADRLIEMGKVMPTTRAQATIGAQKVIVSLIEGGHAASVHVGAGSRSSRGIRTSIPCQHASRDSITG